MRVLLFLMDFPLRSARRSDICALPFERKRRPIRRYSRNDSGETRPPRIGESRQAERAKRPMGQRAGIPLERDQRLRGGRHTLNESGAAGDGVLPGCSGAAAARTGTEAADAARNWIAAHPPKRQH